MISPGSCPHTDTVPVDVRDPTTGGTRTVARICTGCLAQLPAWWGCGDCETTEVVLERLLCETAPTFDQVLTRPCPAHEGA